MGLSKTALIEKLEVISSLYNRILSTKREMDNYEPEDNYEREVIVPAFPGKYSDESHREILKTSIDHTSQHALELVGTKYDQFKAPKKPIEPKINPFKYIMDSQISDKLNKLKLRYMISAGIGGFFLLSIIVGTARGAMVPIIIIKWKLYV